MLGLASNPNWAKVKMKQESAIELNFVENVSKINRANVKVTTQTFNKDFMCSAMFDFISKQFLVVIQTILSIKKYLYKIRSQSLVDQRKD